MKPFHVSVKSTEYGFSLVVDGADNTAWLLERLGRSFVFRSAEPVACQVDSQLCSFKVLGGAQLSLGKLQRLLAEIPEVSLLRTST